MSPVPSACAGCLSTRRATAFADNFDSNTAANWTINRSSADTAVAFNYDYSALGVPSAPNSTNGTTRGVQLKANLTQGVVAALSISPIGQSFAGDYRLHFDAWINVNGPLPGGGASSTEFLGVVASAPPATAPSGLARVHSTAGRILFCTADGDGGVSGTSTTAGDYSAYIGTALQSIASGIYSAASMDNGSVYYQTIYPTGQAPPALQKTDYPQGKPARLRLAHLGWRGMTLSCFASRQRRELGGGRRALCHDLQCDFHCQQYFCRLLGIPSPRSPTTPISASASWINLRVEIPGYPAPHLESSNRKPSRSAPTSPLRPPPPVCPLQIINGASSARTFPARPIQIIPSPASAWPTAEIISSPSRILPGWSSARTPRSRSPRRAPRNSPASPHLRRTNCS